MPDFFTKKLLVLLLFVLSLSGNAVAKSVSNESFDTNSLHSNPLKRSYGRQSPQQQKAAMDNARIKDSLVRQGGLAGAVGTYAVGGVIGSVIFGAAFEHLNAFDLMVVAVIGLIVYYHHERRKHTTLKKQS